jgi:transcription elongation GreA/GreB family factor
MARGQVAVGESDSEPRAIPPPTRCCRSRWSWACIVAARPRSHTVGMKPAQPVQSVRARREALVAFRDPAAGAQLVLTAAEFAACERELVRLREDRSQTLPALFREARSFVAADAAEEIAQIAERQAVLDARIARLADLLSGATVVSDSEASDVVGLGSAVEVEYERTKRRVTYRLTGAATGAGGGAVSAASPVGRALMGRRAGERVSADLPGGRVEPLRVVAITPALAVAA